MIDSLFILGCAAVFYFALLEGGYFKKGRHRGKYQPKASWSPQPDEKTFGDYFIWNGSCTISNVFSDSDPPMMTATLEVPEGLCTIPALTGHPDEQEVRDIVQDELAATPIYTGIRYGGFGDLDIDRADNSDLRLTVSTWLPGDQGEVRSDTLVFEI